MRRRRAAAAAVLLLLVPAGLARRRRHDRRGRPRAGDGADVPVKARRAPSFDIPNRRKRVAARLFHEVGAVLYRVGRALAPRRAGLGVRGEQPRRILVIRVDHIGDVVMSTPLFRALRERYPRAHLTAMVGSWARDVVARNPHLDEVLVYDCPWWSRLRRDGRDGGWPHVLVAYLRLLRKLRAARYDLVLDPRGDFRHIVLFAFLAGVRRRIGYGRSGGDYLLTEVVPWRPELHTVDKSLALLAPLGIQGSSHRTEVHCAPEDAARIRALLASHGVGDDERVATLHPGARVGVKRWPRERFAVVADWLAVEHGLRPVLVGGPDERGEAEQTSRLMKARPVVLAGDLSLLELVALCRRSSLVLCNDSGPMHLAAAAGAPTLALFGPTTPTLFGYDGPMNASVYHRLPCSPCHHDHSCPYGDGEWSRCMNDITPAEVKEQLSAILSGRVRGPRSWSGPR